ncbi:hypothetical protein ON010_g3241 [Phytophthora cinnamomi]|nr:hypothetical protein ON010_g3241 [Phytophthora cinnamomi]
MKQKQNKTASTYWQPQSAGRAASGHAGIRERRRRRETELVLAAAAADGGDLRPPTDGARAVRPDAARGRRHAAAPVERPVLHAALRGARQCALAGRRVPTHATRKPLSCVSVRAEPAGNAAVPLETQGATASSFRTHPELRGFTALMGDASSLASAAFSHQLACAEGGPAEIALAHVFAHSLLVMDAVWKQQLQRDPTTTLMHFREALVETRVRIVAFLSRRRMPLTLAELDDTHGEHGSSPRPSTPPGIIARSSRWAPCHAL